MHPEELESPGIFLAWQCFGGLQVFHEFAVGCGVLRLVLKILHDPMYLVPWKYGTYGIQRSCRIKRSTVGI